jgi:predicted dehydrogenase
MDHVRIGVVGLGNIGQLHTRYLLDGKVRRAALTAVSDAVPARLAPFGALQTFTRSEDLIRSGAVDAVIIATPHYFHTSIGIDALQQGLHVLVEKPISVHKADAQRLIAAHTNPKQVFAAMFNVRTEPVFRKIKKLIEAGELGEIRRINWIITDWFRPASYYASSGWRATWEGEGGGVLLNQCPHQLDLLQWLCGMPVRLRAFCHLGKFHKIEVEDEVTAYLEYANGATGVFVASTGEAPGTNRLEIAGEQGKLVFESGKIAFTRNETPTSVFAQTTTDLFAKPDVWQVDVPVKGAAGQHQEITQNFVDAILDGAPLIAPAEEGLHSVELANAMLFSSLRGETLDLPLDAAAFERQLQELIERSTFQKQTREARADDMDKSFTH